MKKHLHLALAGALLIVIQSVEAQQVVTERRTTVNRGTVTEYVPNDSTIVVRGTAGAPVRYRYTKTTRFVDSAGNVVRAETIKSGTPLTVRYAEVDNAMVADEVILGAPLSTNPAPAATTATTVTTVTSPGDAATLRSTITEVMPDTSYIVVKSDTAPVRYRYTKSTQFVDEEGRIVSVDTVKSGTNATLHYTKTDDDMVLSKVVVTTGPQPIIEKKTRATTETELRR
jgi:fumarylacetoacetate (FAA) hydrolase family protein